MLSPPITGNNDLDAFLYDLQISNTNSNNGYSVDYNTGIISDPNGNIIGYLYQYIAVKYADDNTGGGFSNVQTGKSYFGIRNQKTTVESDNPSDYRWFFVDGTFGTSRFLYYWVLGGRKIKFLVDTSPPDYHWILDNGLVIDLDITVPEKTITHSEIMAETIRELEIADRAVTAAKVNIAAIESATGYLSANSVGTEQLADTAVTEFKIANAAITAAKTNIASVNALTGNLNANSVGSTQITDDAITAPKITAGAIVAGKIAANAVTANTIAAGSIVADKVATNAITSEKIIAGAIVAGKLGVGAVTANTIAAGSIVADKIATNAITSEKIIAGAIVAGKLGVGAVTASTIEASAITSEKIATDAITSNKIIAGAIVAGKLGVNAVTASTIEAGAVISTKIQAGAVTSEKIFVDKLSAITANLGSITAGSILGGNININNKFIVGPDGTTVISSGSSGARVIITNDSIKVYDGVLPTPRVIIGSLV